MAISARVHTDSVTAMSLDGSPVQVCDPDLFDRLYQDFGPRLQRVVRGFVGPDHLVDDVVQETFIRYYQSGVHDFAVRDPWPWLLTVARRLAIDMHRRRNVRRERASDHERLERTSVEVSQLLGNPVSSPENVVVPSRQAMNVEEALRRLEPRHRRILLRKHVEGFKYSEIADAEGMSLEALKSALARARRSFKESYLAVVRSRGFESVFGPLLFPLMRRLRGLRDRVMGSPWVQSMAAGPMSVSAAVDSLAAVVLVLGVAAVGGGIAGASPSASSPTPVVEEVPAWMALDPAPDPDRPKLGGSVESGDAAGADVLGGTTPPADSLGNAPVHDSAGGGGPAVPEDPTHISMDSDDVIPLENPPAEGGGGGGADGDGIGTFQNVSLDDDLDGQSDVSAGNTVVLDCTPSPEMGPVTAAACSGLNAVFGDSDSESGAPESLDEPLPEPTS